LGVGARPEQEDIPPFVYALGSRRGVGDVVTPVPLTNTRTGQQWLAQRRRLHVVDAPVDIVR